MELFQYSQLAMDGHDLVLGEIFEQGNSHIGNDSISSEGSEYLRKQFRVLPGHFKVLLLGKDSRIKLLAETFVSSAELFLRLGTADMPRETAVF